MKNNQAKNNTVKDNQAKNNKVVVEKIKNNAAKDNQAKNNKAVVKDTKVKDNKAKKIKENKVAVKENKIVVMFNLNGKPLPEVEDGFYYNLVTCRKIKNIPEGYICVDEYKVAGPSDIVATFLQRNNLSVHGVEKEKIKIHPSISSIDVEDLTDDLINQLGNFSLDTYAGKGKILNVVDGDTVDLLLYIDNHFLSTERIYSKEKICSGICTSNIFGFFTTMRCRLFGLNTYELSEPRGIKGKEIAAKKYTETKNIVYYRCGTFDKYGRLLVTLYSDKEMKISINAYLLSYIDKELGALAYAYYGGTK